MITINYINIKHYVCIVNCMNVIASLNRINIVMINYISIK